MPVTDKISDDARRAIALLPRCSVCGTPRVADKCATCALHRLEALTHGEETDWMRAQHVVLSEIAEDADDDARRLYPLAFEAVGAGRKAGETTRVISRPQFIFRGIFLTIPLECAAFGTIIDIRVGNKSQLVSSTSIPTSLFCPAAWADPTMMPPVNFDTAVVAQDITIMVSAAQTGVDPLTASAYKKLGIMAPPEDFRAVLWGYVGGDHGYMEADRQETAAERQAVRMAKNTPWFKQMVEHYAKLEAKTKPRIF